MTLIKLIGKARIRYFWFDEKKSIIMNRMDKYHIKIHILYLGMISLKFIFYDHLFYIIYRNCNIVHVNFNYSSFLFDDVIRIFHLPIMWQNFLKRYCVTFSIIFDGRNAISGQKIIFCI